MPRIEILPDVLANQIAAGEVVERPASVVKELVENALDAGAGRISVEIELGGRRLIKVTDDGYGIGADDAKLAFKRHATSKLRTLEDLESILTLGFRGEALASISAVAKVELITKTDEEEFATSIRTADGKSFELFESARSTGTTVTVRDLFHNTPARRKFLRSQPTENYHITSIVTHYALANPSISFALTNNGRETIRVSPAKSLKERAYQLFGRELIESLVPITGDGGEFLHVEGFVSAPRERRTSRDSQYFFINGRFVKDKIVSAALSEGYRSVLPHGVYPVAFLFLDLPPEEVDVNVHPSKTEVRFRRAEAVKDVIASAVKTALGQAGIGDARSESAETSHFEIEYSERSDAELPISEKGRALSAAVRTGHQNTALDYSPQGDPTERNKEFKPQHDVPEQDAIPENTGFQTSGAVEADAFGMPAGYDVLPPVDDASSLPVAVETNDLNQNTIRPLGQLHNSFIIASDERGLLLIDQHVAHERILFDQFRKRESERSIESQNLLIPETIDLTPAQLEAFTELKAELEGYGFSVTELSGRTVAIQSVPTDIPVGEIKNLFCELLDTVDSTKKGNARETIKDSIAAMMACKAAVKINMKLTDEKMNWMIDKLLVTSSPSTCPHGRPVILRITMKDIERRFHRS